MMNIDSYIEKKGGKYLLSVVAATYPIGAFIFNIYLRSLGISDFELLQFRYVLISITFLVISFSIALFFLGLRRHYLASKGKVLTEEEEERFARRLEKIIVFSIIPWCVVYAIFIFPQIPSGLGGAKPYEARLIGKIEKIKEVNAMIAFETGVPVETLPYEELEGKSGLAAGANVLILDKNKDRIFLLLTKDLYLKATSGLALALAEKGENIKNLETSSTKNFKKKPLPINANGIESITLTLYEPSEVLTNQDIEVAASVISANPKDKQATDTISSFIEKKAPEAAEQIKGIIEQQTKVLSNSENSPSKTEPPKEINKDSVVQEMEKIFDTKFLTFRAEIFNKATFLCTLAKEGKRNSVGEREMIQKITETMEKNYPNEWRELKFQENYLIKGQGTDEYACGIKEVFSGAKDAQEIIDRLNTKKVSTGPDFLAIQKEAYEIFQKSSQINTAGDRKAMSRVLLDFFATKSRQRMDAWSESKYLYEGKDDTQYFYNLRKVLTEPKTWEEFAKTLRNMQTDWEARRAIQEKEENKNLSEEQIIPEESAAESTGSGSEE